MNTRLHQFLILLLVLCFLPQDGVGQYYIELVHNMQTKTKIEKIDEFKNATLVVIMSDIPKFKKKKKKSEYRTKYEKWIKKSTNHYNTVVDSFAQKYYPFSKNIIIKSQAAADKLFKDSKGKKQYAYMKLENHEYIAFGLSGQKKWLHTVAFPSNENFASPRMRDPIFNEANFLFIFQRLEKYFERREKGSFMSMKVYRKVKAELKERLTNELHSKTLLIDKTDLDEDISDENISEYFPLNYLLVDSSFIDSVILNRIDGFYYVKLTQATISTKSNPSSNRGTRLTPYQGKANSHYIIDPTDGAAVFFKFNLRPNISSKELKIYHEELIDTYMSPH